MGTFGSFDGAEGEVFNPNGNVSVRFSKALFDGGGHVCVFDILELSCEFSGKCAQHYENEHPLVSLSGFPILKPQLLSGSVDHCAMFWDLRSGRDEIVIHCHSNTIFQAVLADPQARRAVTASYDRTLKVWELRRPSAALATLRGHTNVVYCCAVSVDVLDSGSADRTLRTWLLPL